MVIVLEESFEHKVSDSRFGRMLAPYPPRGNVSEIRPQQTQHALFSLVWFGFFTNQD